MTYRVVQVAEGEDNQSQLQSSAIPTPTQVIPSFGIAEPPNVEGLTADTKLTYVPTVSGGSGDAVAAADASGSLGTVSSSGRLNDEKTKCRAAGVGGGLIGFKLLYRVRNLKM